MESALRRPQLPSLSYPDAERARVEEDSLQNRRHVTQQTLPTSPSPRHHYLPSPHPSSAHPSGPLPPAHHSVTTTDRASGIHTPPESRRTSEQERTGIKQSWQSLPSISEALGVDSKTAFSSTNAPPSSLQARHPPQPSGAPSPASPRTLRPYPLETPPANPPSLAAGHHPPYPRYHPETAKPSYPPPPESARVGAAYPPVLDTAGLPHSQTSPSRSVSLPTHSRVAESSSPYEQPQQAGSMAPPNTFPYGYSPYPPRYALPTPPSSISSGQPYPPSTAYSSRPTSSGWKSEGPSRYDDRPTASANYGENVKRHLDLYDLETALNEIASTSGIITDFSRRYGDRMHQTQRSGATLLSLPSIVEVDDMIAKTRVQHDSLLKIRDAVLAKQAVYEQQVADQRHPPGGYSEPSAPPTEPPQADSDEAKTGGFAGADTKKRRGRAAPPGRCHSCNRAETPEWRRGPDGARTLCNACGLHYAKLTRKNNGGNKNPMVAGSTLRPKESVSR